MSTELRGHGGQIVGSDGYFKSLNGSQLIGKLMRSPERCNYFDAIADAGSKAQNVFEEINQDLRNQIGSIRSIPAANREGLVRMIHGLEGVCAMASCQSGRASACISILELRDPATAPRTNYSESELNDAVRLMGGGGATQLGIFEREETVRKAAEWGESYAIGSNPMRAIFLAELGNGRNREFYAEVMEKLKASNAFSSIRGRCGQDIGSAWYQDYMEREVFGDAAKNFYDSVDYAERLKRSMEQIGIAFEKDIAHGEQNNDYILDENADRFIAAIDALERCGVQSNVSDSRIRKLAWFVGGNAASIRDLQRKLNELGLPGGKLMEDGVYGKETVSAWASFLNKLEHGTVPTLAWLDPLQSSLTNMEQTYKVLGNGSQFIRITPVGSDIPVARLDLHRYNGIQDFYHINSQALPDATVLQQTMATKFDHMPISKEAYNLLKNFDKTAKVIRISGKVLLVAGAVLDAYELGTMIDMDLKDADKKLGKKTVSTAAGIGGRWGGAALGAKLGAMAGGSLGTLALPGIGTAVGGVILGLAGGIGGAFGGDAFAKWIVDITYVGD